MNPDDPLDLTLRQAFGICETRNTEFDSDWGDGPIDRRKRVAEAFTRIHPAYARALLTAMAAGFDNGVTAQGHYHPDFQRSLDAIVADPEERFDRENARWFDMPGER